MRIVIAGGTGFLGSPLAEVYAEEGHEVRVLTRGLAPGEWRLEGSLAPVAAHLEEDAVAAAAAGVGERVATAGSARA